jgi:hypothetical protein
LNVRIHFRLNDRLDLMTSDSPLNASPRSPTVSAFRHGHQVGDERVVVSPELWLIMQPNRAARLDPINHAVDGTGDGRATIL